MNNLPVVRSPWRILILLLGFTFLYAPMLMLVIYSFNSSKLVTVWAGWSTRWYSELFHDDAMMSAVGLSLTIAACAATAAAILGTIAAVVMVLLQEMRGFNEYRMLIFGLTMIVMMIWRPQGLLPMQRPHLELKP